MQASVSIPKQKGKVELDAGLEDLSWKLRVLEGGEAGSGTGRWRMPPILDKRPDELQERRAEPVLPFLCPYLPVFCLFLKQTSTEQEAALTLTMRYR